MSLYEKHQKLSAAVSARPGWQHPFNVVQKRRLALVAAQEKANKKWEKKQQGKGRRRRRSQRKRSRSRRSRRRSRRRRRKTRRRRRKGGQIRRIPAAAGNINTARAAHQVGAIHTRVPVRRASRRTHPYPARYWRRWKKGRDAWTRQASKEYGKDPVEQRIEKARKRFRRGGKRRTRKRRRGGRQRYATNDKYWVVDLQTAADGAKKIAKRHKKPVRKLGHHSKLLLHDVMYGTNHLDRALGKRHSSSHHKTHHKKSRRKRRHHHRKTRYGLITGLRNSP